MAHTYTLRCMFCYVPNCGSREFGVRCHQFTPAPAKQNQTNVEQQAAALAAAGYNSPSDAPVSRHIPLFTETECEKAFKKRVREEYLASLESA